MTSPIRNDGYSNQHIQVLLAISKVYKIESLLESAPKEGEEMQQLRWECLCNRLKTLEIAAKTNDPEIIHELSNITSQLFDLKHHYLLIRNQKKLMLN